MAQNKAKKSGGKYGRAKRSTVSRTGGMGGALAHYIIATCAVVAVAVLAAVVKKFGIPTELPIGKSGKPAAENSEVQVRFLDVGQGDCTLVCSDGKYMLIDTGDRDGDNTVINYLENMGVTELEYLIITHPHSDHMGEAAEIVESFDIGKVIMPQVPDDMVPTSAVYENLLDAMDDKGKKFTAGKDSEYALGECGIQIYAPHEEYSDLNNYSLIVKLTHGENSFLVTGDCEVQEEKELLERGCDLSADVLKAAHHGSDTSSSSEWLQAVLPEYTIISCGANNKYGHPHDDTVSRIGKYSENVYITAEDGTVIFDSDGKGISVRQEK